MSTLMFSLVFTYSGVSYSLYTNLSVHQCVARMMHERTAITHVHKVHPEMEMSIACKPN